jgi:hypothetical protein
MRSIANRSSAEAATHWATFSPTRFGRALLRRIPSFVIVL